MDVSKLAHVHTHMKYLTVDDECYVLPEKAYKNLAWLNSSGAKHLRILSEFMESEQRFQACNVKNTILFFGSARSRSPAEHAAAVKRAEAILADPSASEDDKKKNKTMLQRLTKTAWMCDVYLKVEELARKLTEWSMARITDEGRVPYIVSTGGGPGLMEAANKGAAAVPGAITAGIAISLPFEAGLNKFVTPELGFQMHYFFTRKFALCWPSRALVVCAGGYGSMDECFEILTLMQSGKIELPHLLPVVMFPGTYWKKIVNWEEMVECGVISENDVKMLYFTDDVDDAHAYITSKLLLWEEASALAAAKAAEAAKSAVISAAAAANAAALKAAQLARGANAVLQNREDYAPSPLITADAVRFAKAHSSLAAPALAVGASPVETGGVLRSGAGAIDGAVSPGGVADGIGVSDASPNPANVGAGYQAAAKLPGKARELLS